jgi:hypothetical protein
VSAAQDDDNGLTSVEIAQEAPDALGREVGLKQHVTAQFGMQRRAKPPTCFISMTCGVTDTSVHPLPSPLLLALAFVWSTSKCFLGAES